MTHMVAVGTIISDRPPHRIVRALLRTRLLSFSCGQFASTAANKKPVPVCWNGLLTVALRRGALLFTRGTPIRTLSQTSFSSRLRRNVLVIVLHATGSQRETALQVCFLACKSSRIDRGYLRADCGDWAIMIVGKFHE